MWSLFISSKDSYCSQKHNTNLVHEFIYITGKIVHIFTVNQPARVFGFIIYCSPKIVTE